MKLLPALVVLGVTLSNAGAMKEGNGPIVGIVNQDIQLSQINGEYTPSASDTTQVSTGPLICNPKDKFRTITGECNNLIKTTLGASNGPYKRLLKAAYDDGKNRPRIRSVKDGCGGNSQTPPSKCCLLPSARVVSREVHINKSKESDLSVFVMGWGQFLDHDMDLAGVEEPKDADECCINSDAANGELHPDTFGDGLCFPIVVPKNDSAFKNKRCLEFVRSHSMRANSKANPREQQNIITHYIDASMVYGSDAHLAEELRAGGGLMATSSGDQLPFGENLDCIIAPPTVPKCFHAGDERHTVFPTLTALHTIMVRLHNSLAKQLKDYNTHWDAERVYQEARKIVGAVTQQITYEEFIPKLLDQKTIHSLKLSSSDGFYYDPQIDPSVSNVFATAAYRMGHFLVPPGLNIGNQFVKTVNLFNNGKYIIESFAEVVKGALENKAEERDQFMTPDLTGKLFATTEMGMDLMSLNIQRGRDHGLPSYNNFREHVCKFDRKAFDEISYSLRVYNVEDDIDIFPGAMAEPNNKGVILGETLSCIIGKQFHDSKFGDRFFYLTEDETVGFTKAQLNAIKKYTFAKLLCEFSPLTEIQRDAFMVPSESSKVTKCSELDSLNLTPG